MFVWNMAPIEPKKMAMIAKCKKIKIRVNGMKSKENPEDCSVEDFNRSIDVNIFSAYLMTSFFLPKMWYIDSYFSVP